MSNAIAASVGSTVTTGGSFKPFERVVQFFERLAAARRCAAAISAGRRPAERDLAILELQNVNFPTTLSGN